MRKETAKDIAKMLIAISGDNFDMFAFEDSMDLITEKEKEKILSEIHNFCNDIISKIESKYNIESLSTTRDVIEKIYYEA